MVWIWNPNVEGQPCEHKAFDQDRRKHVLNQALNRSPGVHLFHPCFSLTHMSNKQVRNGLYGPWWVAVSETFRILQITLSISISVSSPSFYYEWGNQCPEKYPTVSFGGRTRARTRVSSLTVPSFLDPIFPTNEQGPNTRKELHGTYPPLGKISKSKH